MTAQTLDGRAMAKMMSGEVASQVAQFQQEHGWAPGIAVVQVGGDPASSWYVKQIEKSFSSAGMRFALHALDEKTDAATLTGTLQQLNADPRTNGIIVQMPLPKHLSQSLVTDMLDRGQGCGWHLTHQRRARLLQQSGDFFAPATPAGGMELLRRYGIELKGKQAVMVGRSNIVGRPMALLMLHEHATVTICHSRTRDLGAVCREGEILVAAIGKAKMITARYDPPGRGGGRFRGQCGGRQTDRRCGHRGGHGGGGLCHPGSRRHGPHDQHHADDQYADGGPPASSAGLMAVRFAHCGCARSLVARAIQCDRPNI